MPRQTLQKTDCSVLKIARNWCQMLAVNDQKGSIEDGAALTASGRLGEFSRFPLPPPHSPRFPDLPAFARTCRAGTGDPVEASAEILKTTRFCVDWKKGQVIAEEHIGQCFIQDLFGLGRYRYGSEVRSITLKGDWL